MREGKSEREEKREADTTQRAICKCCTLIAKGNIEMIAYILCELNAIYKELIQSCTICQASKVEYANRRA